MSLLTLSPQEKDTFKIVAVLRQLVEFVEGDSADLITLDASLTALTSTFNAFSASNRVTTQFDKTSDEALAAITGLSVTLTAGASYSFRIVEHISCAAAGGYKIDLGGGTATATAIVYEQIGFDNSTGATTSTTRRTTLTNAESITPAGTSIFITFEGLITVNAGGTFSPRFAQSSSNVTASSVLVGSTIQVFKIT